MNVTINKEEEEEEENQYKVEISTLYNYTKNLSRLFRFDF